MSERTTEGWIDHEDFDEAGELYDCEIERELILKANEKVRLRAALEQLREAHDRLRKATGVR